MAESVTVSGTTKEEKYASLMPQIKSLVSEEIDAFAALGNIIAALKYGMNFFWIGIYVVKNSTSKTQTLVLGPFQGPVACTRIGFGKGVCGTAWKEKKIIIVNDVDKFDGHIACSSESKSEIVIPIFNKNGEVTMVLDVDSEHYADFDATDEMYLKEVAEIIMSYKL